MRQGAATLIPLTLSILLALGLLILLSLVQDPTRDPRMVTGTLATLVSAIVVMSVTRHQVRALYLEPATSQYAAAAAPQWGNFLLFALLLVAGLATVAYMVRAGLTSGPRSELRG